MKLLKYFLPLLLPLSVFAAAGDIAISQRNSSGNAWITQIFATGNNKLFVTGPTGTPLLSSTLTWTESTGTLNGITMIGIGTGSTAPSTSLHVVDTGTATPRGITNDQYNAGTNSAQFNARKARGTFATPTTIVTGDVLARFIAWGHDGSNFIEGGNIRFTSSGTIAATRVPSQFEVWTSTDATPSVLTKALTIDNAQTATFVGNIIGSGALNAVNVAAGITPYTEFEVDSTSTSSPRGIMSAQFNTGTDGARLHFRKARGTRASPTVVVTGDNLGRLVGTGYDGSNYLEMASIYFASEGTIAATRVPTNISFWTATDATPSVLTLAMTINSAQIVTSVGVHRGPAGTQAAPTYSFTAHTGDGWSDTGAADVRLSLGGTHAFGFNRSGSVSEITGVQGANNIDFYDTGAIIMTTSGSTSIQFSSAGIQMAPQNYSSASWTTTGAIWSGATATVTDSGSVGTRASEVFYSYAAPTLASTNAVTTTFASTVYIANAPTQGTNETITAKSALWIAAGGLRLDGTTGAGAQLGTLTNSPKAGNPTNWIPIMNGNGTQLWFPAWSL